MNKKRKVYVINRIYSPTSYEQFNAVVFVSFDEKKASEYWRKLMKVSRQNELYELVSREIDDTYAVKTILETAKARKNRMLSSKKFRRVRSLYQEVLDMWGGLKNGGFGS